MTKVGHLGYDGGMDVARRRLVLVLTLLGLALGGPAVAEPAWTPLRQADGVSLWGRPVEGSPYWEYRADTVVAPSPEVVWAWIVESRNLPRWLAFVASARDQRVVFQAPWPFASEELEFQVLATGSGETASLALKGRPASDGRAEDPLVVAFTGALVLKPEGGGTFVQFRLHTELSARIPPWLANGSLGELPFQSMRRLRGVWSP